MGQWGHLTTPIISSFVGFVTTFLQCLFTISLTGALLASAFPIACYHAWSFHNKSVIVKTIPSWIIPKFQLGMQVQLNIFIWSTYELGISHSIHDFDKHLWHHVTWLHTSAPSVIEISFFNVLEYFVKTILLIGVLPVPYSRSVKS